MNQRELMKERRRKKKVIHRRRRRKSRNNDIQMQGRPELKGIRKGETGT